MVKQSQTSSMRVTMLRPRQRPSVEVIKLFFFVTDEGAE
jgi:hypothetical protein